MKGSRAFLPFLAEFEDAIKTGRKTMTCRTRAYGKPGDVLDSRAGPIRLSIVRRANLATVRDLYFSNEGLESPEAFVSVWERIHPSGFDPAQVVWVHEFEVVG